MLDALGQADASLKGAENECKALKDEIKPPTAPAKAGSRRKAAELAGRAVDALGDQTATVEERAHRKRRLIKGPREFRDVRDDQPKEKG